MGCGPSNVFPPAPFMPAGHPASVYFRDLSWRGKTLLLLVCSSVFFMLFVVGMEVFLIVPLVEHRELALLEKQVDQLGVKIRQRIEKLRNQVSELAASDDIRELLAQGGAQDSEERGDLSSLRRLPVDFVLAWDAEERLLVEVSPERRKVPLPRLQRSIIEYLESVPGRGGDVWGMLPIPRGYVFFASRRVPLGEGGRGEATLVLGEIQTAMMPESLESLKGSSIAFLSPLECSVPLPGQKEYAPSRFVAAIGENELAGRILLYGSDRKPVGGIEIRAERPLFSLQSQTLRIVLGTTATVMLVLVVAIWIFVERVFNRRIEMLVRYLGTIEKPGSMAALATFPGNDEIGLLARKIGLMASNLHDARDLAVAADRAKMAFLGMMSHELRTPMNGILGFAALLRETPLNAEQRECVHTVEVSGQHLLRLIDDLILCSRAESVGIVLDRKYADLRGVLEELWHFHHLEIERKGLLFEQFVALDVPARIWTDPVRLRQVLSNLLSNAIKFTSKGSLLLSVRMVQPKKDVPGALDFRVVDTGEGIDRDRMRGLFKPFSPGDTSPGRRHSGSGLGLAICHRIVQALEGSIAVDSQPGMGTTVTVTLPLIQPEAPSEGLPRERDSGVVAQPDTRDLGR